MDMVLPYGEYVYMGLYGGVYMLTALYCSCVIGLFS